MTGERTQLTFWYDPGRPRPKHASIRRTRSGKFGPRRHGTQVVANLTLASESTAKAEVLRSIGLRFNVAPADIDERQVTADTPEDLVRRLAYLKAQHVAVRNEVDIILGADTVIADKDGPIGKPRDLADARQILRRLSGETHRVVTGVALIDTDRTRSVTRVATTYVKFRQLSSETIERYIATREPLGKAGAYGLQGVGALLVAEVDGEYPNVFGMPIVTLVDALSDLGYEII